MKNSCAATVTALLILAASNVQADGLVFRLPEDRAWVEYLAEGTEIDANDPNDVKEANGTLTISSVGRETVDGDACRWIEIYFNSQQDNRPEEDQIILKLLIREKHLKRGENPGQHVIRAWQKRSRGQRVGPVREVKVADSKASIEFFNVIFVGPLEDSEKLKPKVVETEKGKLKCAGEKGEFTFEYEVGKQIQDITGTILVRVHDDVPFGVVSFDAETKEPLSKDIVTFRLKLREFGEGAQSQLPDHQ